MSRKQRKKKQEEVIINEETLAKVVPGMLNSARTLINLNEGVKNVFGNIISTILITSQCVELLLKYKIQQEGKKIEKTHKLYDLFKSLNKDTRTEIQNNFDRIMSTEKETLPEGWDDAESVFQKANNALVHWRYVATVHEGTHTIHTIPLYIAALSVYETTHIPCLEFTMNEVTDPVVNAAFLEESQNK